MPIVLIASLHLAIESLKTTSGQILANAFYSGTFDKLALFSYATLRSPIVAVCWHSEYYRIATTLNQFTPSLQVYLFDCTP